MSAVERTAWDPRKYNVARGTTVQDCLAHAIYWFDQLTLTDAERYKAALRSDAASGATATMLEALRQCEEYFDARADAEYFPDQATPVGNEEMGLLVDVRAAIAKATRKTA